MYFKTLYLFCVLQIIQYSYGQPDQPFTRKDYMYLAATESFYKIHTLETTWLEARSVCASEGARLFFPDTRKEQIAVLSYLQKTYNLRSFHVGLSDLASEGHFATVDGKALDDLPHTWHSDEPNNKNGEEEEDCAEMFDNGRLNDITCNSDVKPFICKRERTPCNINLFEYRFNETLGRCYKFYTDPVNWTDAHALCAAEQSYLAVINSQQEADYLVELTKQKHRNITEDYERGTVLLGFHNRNNNGWETVKGTGLEDSGYASWAPQQPNSNGRDKCGSMNYNGLLNDIACDKKSFFICEHEIVTLTTSRTSLLLH